MFYFVALFVVCLIRFQTLICFNLLFIVVRCCGPEVATQFLVVGVLHDLFCLVCCVTGGLLY